MNKHKLLLVKPAQMVGSRIRKQYKAYFPNITLPTLAAYVPHEFDIDIIDETLENIDFSKQYSIIAITALQQNIDRGVLIAKYFKKAWKDKVLVVGGGINFSFIIAEDYCLTKEYKEEILKYFDHIFIGEADYTWPLFLEDFLKGVKREKIIQSEKRPDLKNIPFPRIDLIKWKLYSKMPLYKTNFLGFPKFGYLVPVETSRGCPHDCAYCCVSKYWGKQIRYRPAAEVVKHIKKLPRDTLLIFTDDNIASIPKYTKELFRLMIREKVEQNFFAQFTFRSADDAELIELAAKAGCKNAYLGMESIQPESLVSVNKSSNLPERVYDLIKNNELDKAKEFLKAYYSEVFSKFKSCGIHPFPSVIVGLSGDNVKNMYETVRFLVDEGIMLMTQWFYTPFIGSRHFKDFDKHEIIRYKKFGRFDAGYLVFNTASVLGIVNKDLEVAFWDSYKEFYSLNNILKRISKNRMPFKEKVMFFIINLFYYQAVAQRIEPFTLSWRTKWVCENRRNL